MNELMEICGALKRLGNTPAALATVIKVEGSAYRRPGARMLIVREGKAWGMISGGCLEYDVHKHARKVLDTRETRCLRYDSTANDDILFGTGLGCNGIIDVFIEPVTERFRAGFVASLERCQTTRQRGAIATVVSGKETLSSAERHAFLGSAGWEGNEMLKPLLADPVPSAEPFFISGKDSEMTVFVQPLLPVRQLIIFGGWLDVLPLVRMAKETGFQVCVVDSRKRDASLGLFNEADFVLLGSPRDAMSEIHFDERTVAVVMNHNFERDQEALEALASTPMPFVGLLGPGRRKQRLFDALHDDGILISEEFKHRVHGPVGLDIGAVTPQEIALSIMAEILSVLNERSAHPIGDRAQLPRMATPL